MTLEEQTRFDALKESCHDLIGLAEELFAECSAPNRMRVKRILLRAQRALGMDGPIA